MFYRDFCRLRGYIRPALLTTCLSETWPRPFRIVFRPGTYLVLCFVHSFFQVCQVLRSFRTICWRTEFTCLSFIPRLFSKLQFRVIVRLHVSFKSKWSAWTMVFFTRTSFNKDDWCRRRKKTERDDKKMIRAYDVISCSRNQITKCPRPDVNEKHP